MSEKKPLKIYFAEGFFDAETLEKLAADHGTTPADLKAKLLVAAEQVNAAQEAGAGIRDAGDLVIEVFRLAGIRTEDKPN